MTLQELKQLALHAAKGTAPANFSTDSVEKAFLDGLKEYGGTYTDFQKNKWDLFQIITETVDEVLPQDVKNAISVFAEVKTVPQGQKALFRTRVGRNRAKKFVTRAALSGVYETFRLDSSTFEVPSFALGGAAIIDFERMLDGGESLAESFAILQEGMTEAVYNEIQGSLTSAFGATTRPTVNKYSGAGFDPNEMVKLVNVTKAYGNGQAVIFATPEFIAAMGPDLMIGTASGNFQPIVPVADVNAIHSTGLIKMFRGTPVVEIPQSFVDTSNEVKQFDPQLAFILPAGKEKVVKVSFEGDTHVKNIDNIDWSTEIQMYKKTGVGIVSHHNWAIYQNTSVE